jgi:predicted alpha/beta-fold hydrolase
MPAVPFAPARWLPHPHLQTIYASRFAPAPAVRYRRERWDTPDGDFVDVDFAEGPPGAPWVHLFHGLEGSSASHYARILMHRVLANGWNGSVLNFRGCSGEPNRLPRAYHSGDSDEVDWVLRRLKARLGDAPFFAAGVSLGGNALLKWLGERGERQRRSWRARRGVGADGPHGGRRRARARLSAPLRAPLPRDAEAQRARSSGAFPGSSTRPRCGGARTLREFDNAFTAPVHGFRDTDDYWTRVERQAVARAIRVPTLVINARDDPSCPNRPCHGTRGLGRGHARIPARGGHVGFVSGPSPATSSGCPSAPALLRAHE